MPVRRFGDWRKATEALTHLSKFYMDAARKAVLQEAEYFRKEVVQGIRKQEPAGAKFKELSPWTIAARRLQRFGGSKALIRRGDLIGAIRVHEVGNTVFVGIMRTATSKSGGNLVNIGAIHEFGSRPIVLRITPKMLRYLGLLMKFLPRDAKRRERKTVPGTGIIILRIPARPFFAPVWEKYGESSGVRRRVEDRMRKLLGPKLP